MRKAIAIAFLILNCFTLEANAQNWLWAKRSIEDSLGGGEGFGIASDQHGNAYAVGWYGGTISFDGLSDTSVGGSELIIVKYNSLGNVQWVATAHGSSGVVAVRIAVDFFGNSFITGSYSGWIAFGSDTISGLGSANNFFIAKFDSSGNAMWAKTSIAHHNGFSESYGNGIVVDAEGSAFVIGDFNCDTISFDTHNLVRSGNTNIFIVKYDATGNLVWATSTQGDGFALSITLDKWGKVYITGDGGGGIQFVIGDDTLSGQQNVYFAKFSNDGSLLWVKNFPGFAVGRSITSGASGFIYLAGTFNTDSFSIGSVTLYYSGGYLFIAKFDTSGNMLWAKNGGGSGNMPAVFSSAADVAGNLYLTGKVFSFSSTMSFDQITITNITGTDPMFLVKYDASGNALCATVLSSGADDQNDVAVDLGEDSKYVYVCGDFVSDTFIIGSDTFELTGGEDVFVAKISCDATGIFETVKEKSINLFPNPTQSQVTINNLPTQPDHAIINVYDEQGRSLNLPITFQTTTATLNTQNLPDGFYVLEFIDKQNRRIEYAKFVKQE